MREDGNKELIRRAVAGDVGAFEELVRRHRQGLYSYALGMTAGDHAAASDVLQETLLKAFLNIGRFRGESSFMTWLWRIARNEFVDYRTSPKTSEDASIDDIPERELVQGRPVEHEMTADQRREALHQVLGMLSAEHREAIILIDINEMRYDEAAALLSISESALKSRLFRARENLFRTALEHKKLFI